MCRRPKARNLYLDCLLSSGWDLKGNTCWMLIINNVFKQFRKDCRNFLPRGDVWFSMNPKKATAFSFYVCPPLHFFFSSPLVRVQTEWKTVQGCETHHQCNLRWSGWQWEFWMGKMVETTSKDIHVALTHTSIQMDRRILGKPWKIGFMLAGIQSWANLDANENWPQNESRGTICTLYGQA